MRSKAQSPTSAPPADNNPFGLGATGGEPTDGATATATAATDLFGAPAPATQSQGYGYDQVCKIIINIDLNIECY